VALNTTMAPFDNKLARRAVNFAFDRAATLDKSGGPQSGRVTCQLLPPNFPGYRPYCPFTSEPNPRTGEWNGPDLQQATDLVEQSGTSGAPVEVWASTYT
jgi:peptide/nickel transport system substrate-binding protein